MRLNKRPVQQWVGPCSPFKVRQLRFAAPMGCRALLTATALLASLGLTASPVLASHLRPAPAFCSTESGFNPDAVRAMIARGDAAASRGDLATARSEYDKARKASKQLLGFYRDLSGAFRGLMPIPREMDSKGREALGLLAESNLRLAALFRQNQSVAVPVLVEVVKLMTPSQSQGQQAYQSLVELGFVSTEFKGYRWRQLICQHHPKVFPPWFSRPPLKSHPTGPSRRFVTVEDLTGGGDHPQVSVTSSAFRFVQNPSAPNGVRSSPAGAAKRFMLCTEHHGSSRPTHRLTTRSSMDDSTCSRIETLIATSPVFVFMKGSKLMPQCGFSNNVVQILHSLREFRDF